MAFWKKKQPLPHRPTPEELDAELMARPGSLACSEHGCTADTGLPCEYVDRRERACRTAWCPDHRAVKTQHVYCRRHAGIINALPVGDSSLTMPLPDLDNRAPSLVAWVAQQIDSDVWRMMLRELDLAGGGQLIADPVSLVFVGVERQRAWERAWKLATHDGVKRRVSILVEEAQDHQVVIKVGSTAVAQLLPPWIQHRMAREQVSDEQDAAERAALNAQVLEAMREGLDHERQLSQQFDGAGGAGLMHVGPGEEGIA